MSEMGAGNDERPLGKLARRPLAADAAGGSRGSNRRAAILRLLRGDGLETVLHVVYLGVSVARIIRKVIVMRKQFLE